MAEELWKASAVELAAGIRDKRFSCVEVMTSVVERIRAVNPKLNAIVVDRSEQALAEAAAADRARTSGVELVRSSACP
jgi:amidase